MSTISTGAQFALLNTKHGITLEAFSSFAELANKAAWLHAIGSHEPGGLGAANDAELCDKVLARLGALHDELRTAAIKWADPARLRAPEAWPFRSTAHSERPIAIFEDRYYGFFDAGGVHYHGPGQVNAGGWATADACVKAHDSTITGKWVAESDYYSTDPNDLGCVACCVLTGRQFVDQLYKICGGDAGQFAEYGHWSEPTAPAEKHALTADEYDAQIDALLCAKMKAHPESAGTLLEGYRRAASALAKSVNDTLFAAGAPVGSAEYFKIREACAEYLRDDSLVDSPQVKQARFVRVQAEIHKAIAKFYSKRDQGHVMGAVRDVLMREL